MWSETTGKTCYSQNITNAVSNVRNSVKTINENLVEDFIQILTKYLEDNNCKISVYLEKRHEYFLNFFFSLNK